VSSGAAAAGEVLIGAVRRSDDRTLGRQTQRAHVGHETDNGNAAATSAHEPCANQVITLADLEFFRGGGVTLGTRASER